MSIYIYHGYIEVARDNSHNCPVYGADHSAAGQKSLAKAAQNTPQKVTKWLSELATHITKT